MGTCSVPIPPSSSRRSPRSTISVKYTLHSHTRAVVETMALYTALVKKDEIKKVNQRRRMLQAFLQKLARRPCLCQDTVFQLFLTEGTRWSEEALKVSSEYQGIVGSALVAALSVKGQSVEKLGKRHSLEQCLLEEEKRILLWEGGMSALEECERRRLKKLFSTAVLHDMH